MRERGRPDAAGGGCSAFPVSRAALRACALCPRRCGADRLAGALGYCGAGAVTEVFRYGPHHGEEPPVSGTRGSGTVFFGRCTMRCLYCQNHPWSQEGAAAERRYGVDGLAAILGGLREQGCHNWNLVSPTPWLPAIAEALDEAKKTGAALPVVYNTSGFERVETLRALEGTVAVYLTDLRYARADTAREGSGAADYVEVARAALREMWRQKGPLACDGEGIAVRGTICRLLILPGRAEEAVANLRWLADTVGTGIAVSVMAQYVPAYRAREPGRETWARPIDRAEYAAVRAAVEERGFEDGWVQEFDAETPRDLIGYQMQAGGPDFGNRTEREET